jgi:hypothetical protein
MNYIRKLNNSEVDINKLSMFNFNLKGGRYSLKVNKNNKYFIRNKKITIDNGEQKVYNLLDLNKSCKLSFNLLNLDGKELKTQKWIKIDNKQLILNPKDTDLGSYKININFENEGDIKVKEYSIEVLDKKYRNMISKNLELNLNEINSYNLKINNENNQISNINIYLYDLEGNNLDISNWIKIDGSSNINLSPNYSHIGEYVLVIEINKNGTIIENEISISIIDENTNNLIVPINYNVISNKNKEKIIDLGKDYDKNLHKLNIIKYPKNGLVTINELNVSYKPNNNFVGKDSFEYNLVYESDKSNTGIVSITIQDNLSLENSLEAFNNVELEEVTQSIKLVPGWNLVSFFVKSSNRSINNLKFKMPNDRNSVVKLKSQTQSSTYYITDDYTGWFPEIDNLNLESSYYINYCPLDNTSEGELLIKGTKLDVSTVNLYKGWNWIGYPINLKTEINNMIKNASHLDYIISQDNFSIYYDLENFKGWYPIFVLKPGNGFKYKSNEKGKIIFNHKNVRSVKRYKPIFKNTINRITQKSMSHNNFNNFNNEEMNTERDFYNRNNSLNLLRSDENPNWSLNASDFEFSSTLTAVITLNGVELNNGILVALKDDEVRGLESSEDGNWEISFLGNMIISMLLYGNDDTDVEELKFKYYDGNVIYNITEKINFIPNETYGNAVEPIALPVNIAPLLENKDKVTVNTNSTLEYIFNITDDNNDNLVINIDLIDNNVVITPEWFSYDSNKIIFTSIPSDVAGNYQIKVSIDDGTDNIEELIELEILEDDIYQFTEDIYTDIGSVFEDSEFSNIILGSQLKFINNNITNLEINAVVPEGLSNGALSLNINFEDDTLLNEEIELEITTEFIPEFVSYQGGNVLTQVEMSDLSTYQPGRWAYEPTNSYKVVIQGYLRDFNINNGCNSVDFNAGICEDPHILTFGGNRLDLPHDDKIYNMIDGLGLKINVKSQILGDGCYAKYFYVNYKGEQFIIDIEDLDFKKSGGRVETKYHLLKSCNYISNSFKIEKKIRTLIINTIDGNMQLVFNAEARGLLIRSRLNFTQENSKGIMMSNYADECRLNLLNI